MAESQYPELRGADGIKTCPSKMQTKSFANGDGGDLEILFNSKRNGKKKPRSSLHSLMLEKKKLELWKSRRSFLEDSPQRKAGLEPAPCLPKGRCF